MHLLWSFLLLTCNLHSYHLLQEVPGCCVHGGLSSMGPGSPLVCVLCDSVKAVLWGLTWWFSVVSDFKSVSCGNSGLFLRHL